MFPTIIGFGEMDHGEIWQIPWVVINANEREVTLEVTAPSSGLVLRRLILLSQDQPEFSVSYWLRNRGSESLPFLWACHPLFTLLPDSEVSVQGVENWLRVDSSPAEMSRLPNLPFLGVGQGLGAKWWNVREEKFDSVTLRSPSSGELVISASPEVRHLGIWVDNQIYSTIPTIAIEPAIGWFDDLNLAIKNGTSGRVEPNSTQAWSLFFALR
jgi:galactose mutarotase-like enzyme